MRETDNRPECKCRVSWQGGLTERGIHEHGGARPGDLFVPGPSQNSQRLNKRVTGGIPLFVYWSPVVLGGQLCSSKGVTGLISELGQVSRRSSPLHTGLLTVMGLQISREN